MKHLALAAALALACCAPAHSAEDPILRLDPRRMSPDELRLWVCAVSEREGYPCSDAAVPARAAMPHNDPGAVDLCPPPHRYDPRDGCQ